ncbi:MFS transporter [Mycobacterium sp. 21AC1]|uniref:MFS transporter n=1 Tax=[Mycobacterium] appelbergii TaxID=2939269 RepID=UPI002939047A|nr:MFS transporter [Mycobacterium sp. 21AC1]MDV3128419.1 MFS transporter [Mycobacterium sp. 21AC1]
MTIPHQQLSDESIRHDPPPLRPVRTLLGAGVGNALEWYDWSVYAIFAPFFAAQFFVDDGGAGALLSTLAVFAVGFLMRPVGGFIFGWLADRYGRRFSMTACMMLMAAGSLLIGIAPVDSQVGVWAAVILVVARLAQGLAHGGEIAASYTYVAEIAPTARRGLWSTSMYIAVTAGVVLATLIGAAASSFTGTAAMHDWGWRIPFLIGGVLGFVGLYLRRTLPETEAFLTESDSGGTEAPLRTTSTKELLRGLSGNKANLARMIGLTFAITIVYNMWAIGITGFAISTRGVPASGALWAALAANLVFMATLPLWGKLSDRYGRRPIFMTYSIAFIVLSFPLFAAINDSPVRLFVVMSIALFFLGASVGVMPAYFAELFPTAVRASGIGVPYSFTVAIFGGTAPYIATWLAERDLSWMFAVYAIASVVIGLVTTLMSPETRGRELT